MKLYESDYELLEMICAGSKYPLDSTGRETLQRLWALRDAGLIVIHQAMIPNSMRTSGYAVITDAGRDALVEKQRSEHEMRQNIAKEQADKKAGKRASFYNAMFNLLCALIGAFAGSMITYMLDHGIGIVDLFIMLFH